MTQLSFAPETPPNATSDSIPTSELHCDSVHAPAWLVESVRQSGIVAPVIVGDKGDEGYVVIDGRRRVAAARACKLDTVPCRVYDYSDVDSVASMWGAALNELRTSNPVTNLEAVIDLTARGASAAQIGKATGLTAPTIAGYQAIDYRAGQILIDALKTDKVKFSTVRLALKLDKDGLAECERIVVTDGKLTAKDVRNLLEKAAENFPYQQMLPEAWRLHVVQQLVDLVFLAPANEDTSALTDVINALKEKE